MEDMSFFAKHTYVVSEVFFIVCIYSASLFCTPISEFLIDYIGFRGIITLIGVQKYSGLFIKKTETKFMSLVLYCYQLEKSGFIKLFKGNGGSL